MVKRGIGFNIFTIQRADGEIHAMRKFFDFPVIFEYFFKGIIAVNNFKMIIYNKHSIPELI